MRKCSIFLTQFFAEVDAGVEGLDGEVDGAVDEPQVGQLNLEGLVHGREVDDGVSCDVVLVQRPPDQDITNLVRRFLNTGVNPIK